MEIVLSLLALALAGAGLAAAFALRPAVRQAQQAAADATAAATRTRDQVSAAERLLAEQRQQLEQLRRDLAAQRALIENPPSPAPLTLPRVRGGGLDDLREQLRAAALEAADHDEA